MDEDAVSSGSSNAVVTGTDHSTTNILDERMDESAISPGNRRVVTIEPDSQEAGFDSAPASSSLSSTSNASSARAECSVGSTSAMEIDAQPNDSPDPNLADVDPGPRSSRTPVDFTPRESSSMDDGERSAGERLVYIEGEVIVPRQAVKRGSTEDLQLFKSVQSRPRLCLSGEKNSHMQRNRVLKLGPPEDPLCSKILPSLWTAQVL